MSPSPRFFLYLLLALAALHGAGTEFYMARNLQPPQAFGLLFTFAFVGLCYSWYRTDSRLRSFPRTTLQGSMVVVFPPLAVPFYLFKSRPKNSRLRSILKAGAFIVFFLVVSVGTGIAIQAASGA